MNEAKVQALLEEIRDLSKDQLAEYRKQAARSIALAEEAAARQRSHLVLYKRVLVVIAVVMLPAVAFAVWVLASSGRAG